MRSLANWTVSSIKKSLAGASKPYVTTNTHKGLFQVNHVSSGAAIFQRMMEGLEAGIPNVVVYLDDIVLIGRDHEHLETLSLRQLQEACLRLKCNKCVFME